MIFCLVHINWAQLRVTRSHCCQLILPKAIEEWQQFHTIAIFNFKMHNHSLHQAHSQRNRPWKTPKRCTTIKTLNNSTSFKITMKAKLCELKTIQSTKKVNMLWSKREWRDMFLPCTLNPCFRLILAWWDQGSSIHNSHSEQSSHWGPPCQSTANHMVISQHDFQFPSIDFFIYTRGVCYMSCECS